MMTVEVARDRGWWIARLAYAGQTYRTQGHTLRELREMIDDLFSFVCEDEGDRVQPPRPSDYGWCHFVATKMTSYEALQSS